MDSPSTDAWPMDGRCAADALPTAWRDDPGLMNTAHVGGVGETAFRHNIEDRALFRAGAIEPCEKLRV